MSDTAAKSEWIQRVLGVSLSGGSFSVMRLGKARIEWGGARQNAVAGIGELRTAIAKKFAAVPSQQTQLANALATLDQKIKQLGPTLDTQLDDVLNAKTSNERSTLAATARTTLQTFITYVDGDPIIRALDGNEVLPSMVVTAPMRKTLSDIAGALG